jgi:hypothetical protein
MNMQNQYMQQHQQGQQQRGQYKNELLHKLIRKIKGQQQQIQQLQQGGQQQMQGQQISGEWDPATEGDLAAVQAQFEAQLANHEAADNSRFVRLEHWAKNGALQGLLLAVGVTLAGYGIYQAEKKIAKLNK